MEDVHHLPPDEEETPTTPGPSGSDPSDIQEALRQRTELLLRARRALEREVQKRHRAETHLTFENVVSRILVDARSLPAALPSLLKALALAGRWDAGEYFLLDPQRNLLRWGGLWHRDNVPLGGHERESLDLTIPVGEGVQGRVWSSMAPVWVENTAEEPTISPTIVAAGLRSSLTLPFDGGEGTKGVITFYSRQPRTHEAEVQETLTRVLHTIYRLGQWKWGSPAPKGGITLESLGETLVKGFPLPALLLDPEGKIRSFNEAARDLVKGTQVDPPTLEGYREAVRAQVAGSGQAYPMEKLPAWRALRGESAFVNDLEVHVGDRTLFLEAYAAPVLGDSGEVVGALSLFRDVTGTHQQTLDLQRAKEEAQEADQAKSEFLSRMSHEIRTPLNAILGMIDLLWETNLTQDQQEYVRICRNAGNNLMSLINNILDLSRVQSGQLEIASSVFEVRDFLDKTVDLFALRAHQKGLELTYYLEPGVPTHVVGDPVRLRQILVNLLANAIKFTPKGHVIVVVKRDPKDPNPGTLLVSVSDTGIGIPPDRHEAIFDRFTQASSTVAVQYGGSGLGLTIVKRLLELMGGKIWVESVPGEGSTFTFRVPLQVPPDVQFHTEGTELKDIPILVVEGDAADRDRLTRMLQPQGADLTVVSTARDGLNRFRRAKQREAPHRLIFLGSSLADTSIWEAMEEFARIAPAPSIILMLDPDQLRAGLPRIRETGVTNYVMKPISGSSIMAVSLSSLQSQNLMTKGPPPERAMPEVAVPDLKGLRILLVEDSEDNRFLIQRYLRNTSCRLDMAENGKVAVDKFRTSNYDLILMDLQMPFMDGYTATQTIRQWEKTHALSPTPIIALSAYAIKEEIEKSLAAGCDAHITKPVERAKLFEILSQYAPRSVAS